MGTGERLILLYFNEEISENYYIEWSPHLKFLNLIAMATNWVFRYKE